MGWLFGQEAPRDDATSHAPEIGKVNVLEVMVGQRGSGKSTLECQRAHDLSSGWGGAYVIGHSLGGRFPTQLPDGAKLPLEYHDTIAKLDRALRRHPERWHILAPPLKLEDRETADDLLRYSAMLSDAIKEKAWRKKHPFALRYKSSTNMEGVHATPIIVLIDEGIAIEAAGSTKRGQNRWFMEYLYSLRHAHIALFYSIQNANARSWHLLDQATEIHVFNTRHQWALGAIQAAGATDEEMDAIRRLPSPKQLASGERKHEHVSLSLQGMVDDAPDWARDEE